MSDDSIQRRRRFLDPSDRVSESLFGLIMVLTFTGSLSVAQADREEVRTMLIGALGCNLAWGIIDAVFYLMTTLAERGRSLIATRAVRLAGGTDEARRAMEDVLPEVVASILSSADVDSIQKRLQALPEPPARPRLAKDDYLAAFGVFLWVFASTFPVVLPFLFMEDAKPAMRVSNFIAVAMLLVVGYAFGRHAGYRPWMMGLSMVLVGVVLVAMTIALGG